MRFEAKLISVTTEGKTTPTAAKIANAVAFQPSQQERREQPVRQRRRGNAHQRAARRVQVAQPHVREHDRRAEKSGRQQGERDAVLHYDGHSLQPESSGK
jgi:hypothetical protein